MKKLLISLTAAAFAAALVLAFPVAAASSVIGDLTGDETVNSDDAIYLLRHVLFAGDYPIGDAFADFTYDNDVTSDDAIYLLCHVLFPGDYPINGFAYSLNKDGVTCTIKGIGTIKDEDLNIPSEIDGYAVSGIGEKAFSNCAGLTSVTIGNGVRSIGNYAFSLCSELTRMTIPVSVNEIYDCALSGCFSLTVIEYAGTKDEWDCIEKHNGWDFGIECCLVQCKNGVITINNN